MIHPHHAVPNTDTDAHHGTDEPCEHCIDSECPEVAATLTLTVRAGVRRINGPAQATPDILRALQDGLARLIDINVKGSVYAIEHVDHDNPDADSP